MELARSGRGGWVATENSATTGSGTEPLRIERPLELEGAHAIQTILAAAWREHLQLIVGLGERSAFECHADLVRSRRGEEADLLEPGVHPVQCPVLHLI